MKIGLTLVVLTLCAAISSSSVCAQVPTPTPVNLVCRLELEYSTYLGGGANDGSNGIALDSNNCVYITGFTRSLNFPTENPYQASWNEATYEYGGWPDVFVAKLSSSGSSLIYSTYLGGSSNDLGWAICVDSDHNAYVAGETYSIDFPTQNPYQASLASTIDGFVAKLASSGSLLIYSTYLGGGSGNSGGAGIAVDSVYCVYISGYSESSGFPLQNPYQSSLAGYSDVIITKFSSTGSSLIYSTYLGGILPDIGWDIAVSSDFCAYVVGEVGSINFPTYNSYQPSIAGGSDVFLTKLSSSGSSLLYSTYLGGNTTDDGRGISIDTTGSAYLTGYTGSLNFPTFNAYQASRGGTNAFLTKFSTSGSSLVYSTYLGGEDSGKGIAIFVDTADCAYITGRTSSSDFPTKNPYQSSLSGLYNYNDAFVTKFSSTGSSLLYSTYLGGGYSGDYGWGIAVDSEGCVYVSGDASSVDFPTVNPYQSGLAGSGDVFIAKLKLICYQTTPTPAPTPPPFILESGDYNGDGTCDVAVFDDSSGLWGIRDITLVYYGSSGDRPVPGDYDGNGCADIALFRSSAGLWLIRDITRAYFGVSGDIPVPAIYRWYGAGEKGGPFKSRIAIFRPSTGLWAIRGYTRFYCGTYEDIPVPADYDGNSLSEPSIFRPSTGLWAVRDISRAYFGSSGDIPVTR